jgi:CTP synthase
LPQANSTEFNPKSPDRVIDLMKDQKYLENMGGTMRLGAYTCDVKSGTLASSVYDNAPQISERHRHRYEFNDSYLSAFEANGMIASGKNPDANLVEIMELSPEKHPFFIGVQFHPELRSTVLNPHPLFVKFIAAAAAK